MNIPIIVFDTNEHVILCKLCHNHRYKKCFVPINWYGDGDYFCERCYDKNAKKREYLTTSLSEYLRNCEEMKNNAN